VTADQAPYKQRKVRILNGAHTTLVLAALLAGKTIVRECLQDPATLGFVRRAVFEEIIPTLSLPPADLTEFAEAVLERFANPYIDHRLADIALNSTSKWRARVLPSVVGYAERFGAVPPCLTLSFAAYLAYYRAGLGRDEAWVLDWFAGRRDADAADLVTAACVEERFWGRDLTALPGFAAAARSGLAALEADPARAIAELGGPRA